MLRLQGRGMDPVRMEALVDNLGRLHEVGDQFIRRQPDAPMRGLFPD